MNTEPLRAAAKSGTAQPKAGIAGQPDPLASPEAAEAAKDGAAQLRAGRAVRLPEISAMVNAALACDSEAGFGVRISELRQVRTPRRGPFNS